MRIMHSGEIRFLESSSTDIPVFLYLAVRYESKNLKMIKRIFSISLLAVISILRM